MNVPDGIEPVRGYRAWYLQSGHLKPTNSDHLWYPGDNEALCYADEDDFEKSVWKNVDGELKRVKIQTHGLIPEPSCHCGFWMLKTPQNLIDRIIEPKPRDPMYAALMAYNPFGPSTPPLFVVGQVRGWGRVLPGKNGWRAEFAAVESFVTADHNERIVTGRALRRAAKLYDVPIVHEEAFDGQAPPTRTEKVEARKKARGNWTSLHEEFQTAVFRK